MSIFYSFFAAFAGWHVGRPIVRCFTFTYISLTFLPYLVLAKPFVMKKHLAPPNYFRTMVLLGVALLLTGLGLLVIHETSHRTYFIAYAGLVLLAIGAAGMVFFKPRS